MSGIFIVDWGPAEWIIDSSCLVCFVMIRENHVIYYLTFPKNIDPLSNKVNHIWSSLQYFIKSICKKRNFFTELLFFFKCHIALLPLKNTCWLFWNIYKRVSVVITVPEMSLQFTFEISRPGYVCLKISKYTFSHDISRALFTIETHLLSSGKKVDKLCFVLIIILKGLLSKIVQVHPKNKTHFSWAILNRESNRIAFLKSF